MRLRVNGEERTFEPSPVSLEALVGVLGLDPLRVAVEVNGRVVRRVERRAWALEDGDAVEIVTLVGGG